MFQVIGDFSAGFECVLVHLLKIHFSECKFISEGRPSYPLSGDVTILCAG